MKIIKLKGGLGNQMFQYAYAKLLENMTGEEIRLDYSAFQTIKNDAVRVPRLKKFDISIPEAQSGELKKICMFKHQGNSLSYKYKAWVLLDEFLNRKYYREHTRAYIPPESLVKYSYFDGYWQSWRYVDPVMDVLEREFTPNYELSEKTKAAQETMRSQNSVFVGVRKGDYAAEAAHWGSFGTEYYRKAMNYIGERAEHPVFYIFSNDIEWCKKNIDWGNFRIIYREPEQQTSDFEELMLMAACKHSIIINSTYHWWGARLSDKKDKIVVAPKKWFFDNKPIDIIPPGWVRM